MSKLKRTAIFSYSFLFIFCLGALIKEVSKDFRSIILVKYSLNAEEYFFKDRLYFTKMIKGSNSSGSQGSFIYYGIIESNKKRGHVKGWINKMKRYRKFDEVKDENYYDIWYCPSLDIIMGLVEGNPNSKKNKTYQGYFFQSWFRIILSFLVIPIGLKLFFLIKTRKSDK